MRAEPPPTAQELFGPAGTPTVVVIGAGMGGIAAGVKLRRAGIETFTIYESSTGVGGTWWDNTAVREDRHPVALGEPGLPRT